MSKWDTGWPAEEAYVFDDCDENYRRGGIYVLEFEDGGIKVGQSKCLRERLANYRLPWTKKILRIACFRSRSPKSLEKFLIDNIVAPHVVEGSREYAVGLPFEDVVAFLHGNKFYRPNLLARAPGKRITI